MPSDRSEPLNQFSPLLGLATSEELIRELIARFSHNSDPGDIDRALALAEMVGRMSARSREYRTVDGD